MVPNATRPMSNTSRTVTIPQSTLKARAAASDAPNTPIHPSSSIGCIGARVASIRKSRSMTANGLPARARRIVTTSSYQKLSRPSWYPRRPAATATIAARMNPTRQERRRSRTRDGPLGLPTISITPP